jgi:iron complex transport system substrate-binding protein
MIGRFLLTCFNTPLGNAKERFVSRIHIVVLSLLVLVMAACAVPVQPLAEPASPAVIPAAETLSVGESLAGNLTDGCVEAFDESVDYFPQKLAVGYASGFDVEYFNNYKIVTVTNPWQGAEDSFQYVLVQCGTPAPDGYDQTQVIEVPVQSIIALSTTYMPHLETLGVVDRLVGIDSYLWTTTPAVQERIAAGDVAEVGSGSTINVEQVLDVDPDLVMAYGIGIPDYDTHPVLLDAGVTTVLNGDFVEQNPLGRTEWMKFVALFFNQEGVADELFDQIAQEYAEVAELAAGVPERPTVLVGGMYNGTWYISGGDSYTARLLADAGADYLWANEAVVASLPVDFESVYEQAADADFWVNPDNSFWFTLEDVLASDERYGDFTAAQEGRLYNNNAIVNANGGNAFYESGAANPHIVLKDLVKIFHPELLPEHELVYYRLVE